MACKNVCRLCDDLAISSSVTFANGTLTINLPAGSFNNGEQVCIVVAQSVPVDTTISAPVVITIGADAAEYPLVTCTCAQLTASALRTRTRYKTCVETNATGAVFKLVGKPHCSPSNALESISGAAAAAGGGA